eukprot:IDg19831t1
MCHFSSADWRASTQLTDVHRTMSCHLGQQGCSGGYSTAVSAVSDAHVTAWFNTRKVYSIVPVARVRHRGSQSARALYCMSVGCHARVMPLLIRMQCGRWRAVANIARKCAPSLSCMMWKRGRAD